MDSAVTTTVGVVRGSTVELRKSTGLADGAQVTVTLQPVSGNSNELELGEGLRRAFGAWSEDAAELDQFVEQIRERRQHRRLRCDG